MFESYNIYIIRQLDRLSVCQLYESAFQSNLFAPPAKVAPIGLIIVLQTYGMNKT
jgi:hypothetical protein